MLRVGADEMMKLQAGDGQDRRVVEHRARSEDECLPGWSGETDSQFPGELGVAAHDQSRGFLMPHLMERIFAYAMPP